MAGNTGARAHSRGHTRHNCAGLDSNKIDKWALRVGLMSTHQAPSVCALPSREGSSLERHQSAEPQPASCCGVRHSRKHAPKTRSVFACLALSDRFCAQARFQTDFAPKPAASGGDPSPRLPPCLFPETGCKCRFTDRQSQKEAVDTKRCHPACLARR